MKPIQEFDVFYFTCRLLYRLHPEAVTIAADDPMYDALRRIADGEICLASSPQEMSKIAAPQHKETIEAYLQRNVGKVIERDKQIAQMILNQMNESG